MYFYILFVVNVAVFTDSEIIDMTAENIGGEKYDYSQIEKISEASSTCVGQEQTFPRQIHFDI